MRSQSPKRAKQMREYRKLRTAYLAEHPVCELCDKKKSKDIHHKAKRFGSRLTMVEHFMAVCRPCHDYIESNKSWARENNYLYDI